MDPAGQAAPAAAGSPAQPHGSVPAGQAPGWRRAESVTRGGVRVIRTEEPFRADDIDQVCARVDERRGGVLSSGMEYPGRYSRWHLAYVNPCAEIVARGRVVTVRALNRRGAVLLPVFGAALARAGQPAAVVSPDEVSVTVPEPAGLVAEEDRSRRPTVFSAVREVIAAFAGDEEHLGLYGAFGYDLAFQFEPVTPRLDRPAGQRDLVLHLPDELFVVDRKRETAMRYSYEFTVDGVSTSGLPRDTPASGAAGPATGRECMKNAPSRGPTPGSWRRPRSGSSAATCSRWCRASRSARRAPRPPRSTSCCAGATRRRTSSSSTWARGSAWSGRRRRCTCG